MKKVCSFFLTLCLMVGLFSVRPAQAQLPTQTYSVYTAVTAPQGVTYVPLSAANSTQFTDLRNTFPSTAVNNGPSIWGAGNLDEGRLALEIPFKMYVNTDSSWTAPPLAPPTGLVNAENLFRVYTNGVLMLRRSTGLNDGFGYFINYTVNGTEYFYPNPANVNPAWYGNSTIPNYVFGFCGDLDLSTQTSGVQPEWYYGVRGTAPNRQAIIEWRNARIFGTSQAVTFQMILNENGRTVDVVFGGISGGSTLPQAFYTGINEGTGALAPQINAKSFDAQNGNFFATRFNTTSNAWEISAPDAVMPYGSTTFPTQNVRICRKVDLNGQVSVNGALFDASTNSAHDIPPGTSTQMQFTVTNQASSTAPGLVTTTITGVSASSYSIASASGQTTNPQNLAPGQSHTYVVTFSPQSFGLQSANIVVTMQTLATASCPNSRTIGNIALNGRGKGLTPITSATVTFGKVGLNNTASLRVGLFKNDVAIPLAWRFDGVTPSTAEFTFIGGSGTGANQSLTGVAQPGDTVYFPVRFNPTSVGVQTAIANFRFSNVSNTIQSTVQPVTIIGEGTPTRIRFTLGTSATHLPSGSVLAQNVQVAVGEDPGLLPFTVSNTGAEGLMTMTNFRFIILDDFNLVNGRFLVKRDSVGQPIASRDFFIETRSTTGIWSPINLQTGMTISAGTSIPMRIVFKPVRPGRVFARLFFNTSALVDENNQLVRALNENEVMTNQLQAYDMYGMRARNSRVDSIPQLKFPPTEIGSTTTATVLIKNTGDSRLLIEKNTIAFMNSDPDFTLVSAFPGAAEDNGRYVILPDSTGRITIRFTPRGVATRVGILRLISNDSTPNRGVVGIKDIAVSGIGLASARVTVSGYTGSLFPTDTAIVELPSTYVQRNITLTNTGASALSILTSYIRGRDSLDYRIVAQAPQTEVRVGLSADVVVEFAPKSGGAKQAELVIPTNAANNNPAIIPLRGFGGVRTASLLTSDSLFVIDSTAISQPMTRTIAVRNTGNVPLTINPAAITGTDAVDYSAVSTTAIIVAAGATQDVSITLQSAARGYKRAAAAFTNNSTNRPQIDVQLFGFVGTRQFDVNPKALTIGGTLDGNGNPVSTTICIDVTNNGDLALNISAIKITGQDAVQFTPGTLPPNPVLPGMTVKVCFSYKAPSRTSPPAKAKLVIESSDANPGTAEVDINATPTSVSETETTENGYVLAQAIPTPADDATMIRFSTPIPEFVTLEMYSSLGEKISTPFAGISHGSQSISVQTAGLPSGVYFYKLTTSGFTATRTITIVR